MTNRNLDPNVILVKENRKYYQQVPYFLGNNANIMVNN